MKKLLVLVTLTFIGTAGQVEAGRGFFGWMEKFSGPGPFLVIGHDVPFRCYGVRRADAARVAEVIRQDLENQVKAAFGKGGGTEPGSPSEDRRPDAELLKRIDAERYSREVAATSLQPEWIKWKNCNHATPYARNLEFGADVQLMWAKEDETEPFVHGSIWGFGVLPYFDVQASRSIQVGAGFGFLAFDGETFDGFARPLLQPLRLTFKLSSPNEQRGVRFRVTATALTKVDGTQFGLPRTAFEDALEVQIAGLLIVDY
jgi:hypothetical protein